MAWIELRFQTIAEHSENLSSLLEELGALAVSLQDAGDQPIYEPSLEKTPVWDKVLITGLFEEQQDIQKVLAVVCTHFARVDYTVNVLDERDWEKVWMENFPPMSFGKRLQVVPSHHQTGPSLHCLVLDPGLAFGTGKHPTTALCLRWLDEHIMGQEILIDYGCGSGILGMAALKLGAHQVLAVDHDPQAIQATQQNAHRNGLSKEQLYSLFPKQLPLTFKADILIANILANPLIELAESFANHLKADGKIVLSGILREQTDMLLAAYSPWFNVTHIEHLEEWSRLDAIKKSRTTRP